MPGSHKPLLTAIGAVALGVSLAAGGAVTHASVSASPTLIADVTYDPAPVDPDPNAPTIVTPATAPTTPKVSANNASEDAIAAALQAAGVASPKRWAAEVVEYRPYLLDDLGLTKLVDNLLKYSPAPAALQGILSVLQLP